MSDYIKYQEAQERYSCKRSLYFSQKTLNANKQKIDSELYYLQEYPDKCYA